MILCLLLDPTRFIQLNGKRVGRTYITMENIEESFFGKNLNMAKFKSGNAYGGKR